MIKDMFDYGALPALERMVQFTGARHKVLADNIANLSTPFYQPRDLDPKGFQAALGDAIDRRRASARPADGPLEMHDTPELRFREDRVEAAGEPRRDNLLFHDQNNRDLERLMADLAENTLAHNAGVELVRNHFALLQTAIRERV